MGLCFLKTLLLPEAPGLEEALKSFQTFFGQIKEMPYENSKHPYKINIRSSIVHKNIKFHYVRLFKCTNYWVKSSSIKNTPLRVWSVQRVPSVGDLFLLDSQKQLSP